MGEQLKTKAFTLIELLAIIVILAIIAVITVPIILGVIDNAKKGSVIDSAYGYKDAVDKYYITKLMEEDFELNDIYSVSDGKLGDYDIPFTGMKPISGSLTYENNILTEGCLTFDDYKVSYDGSKFTSEKGVCEVTKEIEIPIARTIDDVDYYDTAWIGTNPIYYNPVTGAKCDNYHEDNSKTGYNGVSPTGNQTSCLKWYAYSGQDGNVNLLLDHNTTAKVAWVTEDDYGSEITELATTLGITYPNGITGSDSYGSYGNWNKGPITLLNQLKTDTDGWSGVASRIDSYIASNNYNSETVIDRYTIDYSGYKARIITAVEIAYITGNESWNENTSSSSFYFDSKTSTASSTCKADDTSGCSYGWLYERTTSTCETYGCLNNSDVEYSRYWTVSPYVNDSYNAGYVTRSGSFNNYHVNNDYYTGVRPVITVSKSSIFES